MVFLTKTSEFWVVEFELPNREADFQQFTTIESASTFMTKYLKIQDEAIDDALIEMTGHNRLKAMFGDRGELLVTK